MRILLLFLIGSLFFTLCFAEMLPQIPGLDRGVTVQNQTGSVKVYDVIRLVISPDSAMSISPDGTVTIDVKSSGGGSSGSTTFSSDIVFMFDGGGYVLPIGKKGWVRIPSNFTITGWNMTITPDVSTVTCDLYVASYDYYPPNSTMILNTKYRPFVFKGDQRRDTNVTTSKWRFHTLSQDMYLKCVVISVDGAKAMNLTIYGTR